MTLKEFLTFFAWAKLEGSCSIRAELCGQIFNGNIENKKIFWSIFHATVLNLAYAKTELMDSNTYVRAKTPSYVFCNYSLSYSL
jgi:hypothetical protein